MIRSLIISLLVLLPTCGWALVSAPNLVRACLNPSDSIVTLDFGPTVDACGSFDHHTVFASENGVTYSPFSSVINISVTQVQFKLPNANATWSFYLMSTYLCNGVDSVSSDTLSLDISEPPISSIDSVSIGVATQNVVIGWTKNPATDTKGYRLYTLSNAINSRLGDTSLNAYVVTNQNVTLKTRYTLAAFDSCNLFSPISSPHSPITLSSSLDTCSRSAQLSWTPYEGWVTNKQVVYASLNGSTFQPLTASVAANSTKFQYTDIRTGDSLCYFVRAYSAAPQSFSSSSNVSCIKMEEYRLPEVVYLSQVTVESKDEIKIECYVENNGPSDSLVFYRWDGSETQLSSGKLLNGSNFYSFSDNNVSTDYQAYEYRVRTFAPCLGATNASSIGNSIHLQIDGGNIQWNEYANWDVGVQEYEVLGLSSTWNTITTTTDLSYQNTDTTIQCFQVVAKEEPNQYGFVRESRSNIVCADREPKFFIPNALNPLSPNNTLTVKGPSIDPSSFEMIVFNRWGEQIFKTSDINEGWKVDDSGPYIPLGVYFYDISLEDLKGNRHRLNGSIRIIR